MEELVLVDVRQIPVTGAEGSAQFEAPCLVVGRSHDRNTQHLGPSFLVTAL